MTIVGHIVRWLKYSLAFYPKWLKSILAFTNNDLFKQYTYINTQLNDVQEELTAVKKKNKMLQQIAVQVGELESTLENLTLERDQLKNKIYALENEQAL